MQLFVHEVTAVETAITNTDFHHGGETSRPPVLQQINLPVSHGTTHYVHSTS